MDIAIWVIVGIIVVLILFVWIAYNSLVQLERYYRPAETPT